MIYVLWWHSQILTLQSNFDIWQFPLYNLSLTFDLCKWGRLTCLIQGLKMWTEKCWTTSGLTGLLHRQQMILNSITRSHLCTGSILKPSEIWLPNSQTQTNRHVVKCALVEYLPEPRGPCASDFGSTLMFKENGRWVYPKRDIYKKI